MRREQATNGCRIQQSLVGEGATVDRAVLYWYGGESNTQILVLIGGTCRLGMTATKKKKSDNQNQNQKLHPGNRQVYQLNQLWERSRRAHNSP